MKHHMKQLNLSRRSAQPVIGLAALFLLAFAILAWPPIAGTAFEYEFAGEAASYTNGFAIDAPSLKGGTGIAEAGLLLTPSQTLPLSLALSLQGYPGQREGITSSVQQRFAF